VRYKVDGSGRLTRGMLNPGRNSLRGRPIYMPVMSSEAMREELLKAAVERRTVTYGYLMDKFGISRGPTGGETVVGAIAEIDKKEYERGAPGFAAIVVRKDTGYPGGGFFCWEGLPPELRRPKSESQNSILTDEERRYVDGEREKIWTYYQHQFPTHLT
jgi:hypothetical protein